jgi:hypothetical protein
MARERVGPLEGPVTVWRELTSASAPSEEEARASASSTRCLAARLVRGMREEGLLTALEVGAPLPLVDLEARLLDLCSAHRLMLIVLRSWWRERSCWTALSSIAGAEVTARRVLDSYTNWFIVPPWSPGSRVRLVDVLPERGDRPAARPHLDAIVDRLSAVLIGHEFRQAGVRAKDSWLWAHRLLGVARGTPGACELMLPGEGSLEQAHSEGLELFRRLGAPLPRRRRHS